MTTSMEVMVLCRHCQRPVEENDVTVECSACGAAYHQKCWEAIGGCIEVECASMRTPAKAVVPGRGAAASAGVMGANRKALTGVLVGVILLSLVALAILVIRPGHSVERWILVAVVLAALGFDFVNGMNDSANSIATVVSTRVLTPAAALLMAAVMDFSGAVLFEGVAKTIAGKIVDPTAVQVTMLMILCGLIGAVAWSWAMTQLGLPVSLSHSLIGGLLGVLIVAGAPINTKSISGIFLWMIIAPILGFIGGLILMVAIMWIFQHVAPHKMNKHFRFWQMFSSASMAFSHGANDAQKAMGIITLALVAGGVQHVAPGAEISIPIWVKIACATVIALGTGIGGWKVIRTLGHKMIKLQPVHGFAAETAAAATIQFATILHMPVSTTHVISSSIMGVGASKRLSAVRWGVARNIVMAWVFTIPACAGVGALLYFLVRTLRLDLLVK